MSRELFVQLKREQEEARADHLEAVRETNRSRRRVHDAEDAQEIACQKIRSATMRLRLLANRLHAEGVITMEGASTRTRR